MNATKAQLPNMVKDIAVGSVYSSPSNLLNVNGTLFFRAAEGINGFELWKSDGTTGGTAMLKEINPGSGSSCPNYFTVYNGKLYFL